MQHYLTTLCVHVNAKTKQINEKIKNKREAHTANFTDNWLLLSLCRKHFLFVYIIVVLAVFLTVSLFSPVGGANDQQSVCF